MTFRILPALLLLSACTTPGPREPSGPVLPFGTYPQGAEDFCKAYLAELQSSNDEGTAGRIYDLTDPTIAERLTRPSVLTRVNPDYPSNALQNGQDGDVVLAGIIERGGRVSNVKVLIPERVRGFDAAALESFRQWTFQPARIDGRFSRSYYCTTIRFRLEDA